MGKFTPPKRGKSEPEPSADDEPTARCDVDAFQAIARQHEAHLRMVALRLAGDAGHAEELVRETLARALFNVGQLVPGSSVRAWLTTILTRLYLDPPGHEPVVNQDPEQPVTLERIEINLDLTMPRVTDEALRAALASLEPELRQVLELCCVQQLSYREIADRLGVPIRSVGLRSMRAHQQLRARLRGDT